MELGISAGVGSALPSALKPGRSRPGCEGENVYTHATCASLLCLSHALLVGKFVERYENPNRIDLMIFHEC